MGCLVLCVGLRTYVSPGESLHGYRICIQAILQDKPKIATMNLGKVSQGGGEDTRRLGLGGWVQSTLLDPVKGSWKIP